MTELLVRHSATSPGLPGRLAAACVRFAALHLPRRMGTPDTGMRHLADALVETHMPLPMPDGAVVGFGETFLAPPQPVLHIRDPASLLDRQRLEGLWAPSRRSAPMAGEGDRGTGKGEAAPVPEDGSEDSTPGTPAALPDGPALALTTPVVRPRPVAPAQATAPESPGVIAAIARGLLGVPARLFGSPARDLPSSAAGADNGRPLLVQHDVPAGSGGGGERPFCPLASLRAVRPLEADAIAAVLSWTLDGGLMLAYERLPFSAVPPLPALAISAKPWSLLQRPDRVPAKALAMASLPSFSGAHGCDVRAWARGLEVAVRRALLAHGCVVEPFGALPRWLYAKYLSGAAAKWWASCESRGTMLLSSSALLAALEQAHPRPPPTHVARVARAGVPAMAPSPGVPLGALMHDLAVASARCLLDLPTKPEAVAALELSVLPATKLWSNDHGPGLRSFVVTLVGSRGVALDDPLPMDRLRLLLTKAAERVSQLQSVARLKAELAAAKPTAVPSAKAVSKTASGNASNAPGPSSGNGGGGGGSKGRGGKAKGKG